MPEQNKMSETELQRRENAGNEVLKKVTAEAMKHQDTHGFLLVAMDEVGVVTVNSNLDGASVVLILQTLMTRLGKKIKQQLIKVDSPNATIH